MGATGKLPDNNNNLLYTSGIGNELFPQTFQNMPFLMPNHMNPMAQFGLQFKLPFPYMNSVYYQQLFAQNLANIMNQAKSQNSLEGQLDKMLSTIGEVKAEEVEEKGETPYERDFSLENENLHHAWSGFLSKNKEKKAGVDAYQLRNECADLFGKEFNLNITHRTQFEEIFKRKILGVIVFSPNNETQSSIFEEYIKYFEEKSRAGVVNLKDVSLYVLAPSEISRKFYKSPKKHLLGIFFNPNEESKLYVDMDNLELPPAIISKAEKETLTRGTVKQEISKTRQNLIKVFNVIEENTEAGKALYEIFVNFVEPKHFVRENMDNLEKDPQVLSLFDCKEITSFL